MLKKLRENYTYFPYISSFAIKNKEYFFFDSCKNDQENYINNEKIKFFYLCDLISWKILSEICCVDRLGLKKKKQIYFKLLFSFDKK